jgi:DNA helicase-2/ATP-dependent DNA helicase PcrA
MDLAHLNPPQREAVLHGSGPVLVLAGAGSGKTRVITHRIARLLALGIPPQAIAALTFTNKAAEEMRERVAALIGAPRTASALTMGTFHSLGLNILKQERQALGFPRGFVIYDTADQLGCLREIMRRVALERRYDTKAILTRISLAKNAFITPENYAPAEGDEYDAVTREVYPLYQEALRSFAAVDFDDLITEPVRLFETSAEVRERWASKFRYVMVDEYQDTNRAQLLLVKHLVAEHGNLCVVGDDDQSIYSWRGADPSNILDFADYFPGARIIKLEQNYRSTPTILAAANAVIANNARRHGKVLWSDGSPGDPIVVVTAPEPAAEARFVAGEIETLCHDRGLRHGDFAVLYRSNNQASLIEEELRARRIPYVMYGGQQFFERKEVKDLIAYLRVALNPRDEIALRRVINYPARGIGTGTVERLAERSRQTGGSMWQALTQLDAIEGVRGGTRDAAAGFMACVQRLRAALQAGEGVAAAARQLVEDIGLYEDLQAAAPSQTAARRRIDNVEGLIGALERQQAQRPGLDSLAEYLRRLSLSPGERDAEREPGNCVTLTTLHGAKGLEYPVVFLVGAEEELLPHARTLSPHATDVMDVDHATDVSEERRLAYVGITRAKRHLYLSRCLARAQRGRAVPRTPSRFLLEIPAELVTERDAAREAATPVETGELRAFFQSLVLD